MEIAVDVAILDPATRVAVVRGGEVDHPKYRGQRIFGAGINLTHLYRGKIPFVWYMQRDLGYVHKMFRGVARPDALPDDVHGWGVEKPWIAAVDSFAIGGHCQALLVMDYVVAAADAYMTLPARKEGIIPGAANLRLPRFVGDRLARQLVQYERRLACDSPEGRLICDEIAPVGAMDASIDRIVAGLTIVRRCRRDRQPSRLPRRRRAARPLPALHGGLCARTGLLPFQPGADRQSRALLGRAEQKRIKARLVGASRHAGGVCAPFRPRKRPPMTLSWIHRAPGDRAPSAARQASLALVLVPQGRGKLAPSIAHGAPSIRKDQLPPQATSPATTPRPVRP